jgi:hypothetical protein
LPPATRIRDQANEGRDRQEVAGKLVADGDAPPIFDAADEDSMLAVAASSLIWWSTFALS